MRRKQFVSVSCNFQLFIDDLHVCELSAEGTVVPKAFLWGLQHHLGLFSCFPHYVLISYRKQLILSVSFLFLKIKPPILRGWENNKVYQFSCLEVGFNFCLESTCWSHLLYFSLWWKKHRFLLKIPEEFLSMCDCKSCSLETKDCSVLGGC